MNNLGSAVVIYSCQEVLLNIPLMCLENSNRECNVEHCELTWTNLQMVGRQLSLLSFYSEPDDSVSENCDKSCPSWLGTSFPVHSNHSSTNVKCWGDQLYPHKDANAHEEKTPSPLPRQYYKLRMGRTKSARGTEPR